MVKLPQSIENKHIIFLAAFLMVYLTGSIYAILTPLLMVIIMFLAHLILNQESVLYVPDIGQGIVKPSDNPQSMRSPKELRMDFEDLYIKTADEVRINCWWIRPDSNGSSGGMGGFETVANKGVFKGRNGRPSVLFCHANAGNMGIRNPNFHELYNRLKCNIFAFDYRGYGNSDGTPSEDGLLLDALACLQYMKVKLGIEECYIFGRSLGGAVAVGVCKAVCDLRNNISDNTDSDSSNTISHYPRICGLILENTFTSIPEVADKVFPFLAWPGINILKKLFIRLSWNSADRIKALSYVNSNSNTNSTKSDTDSDKNNLNTLILIPILILVGEKDEIIPPEMSRRLKNAAVEGRSTGMNQKSKSDVTNNSDSMSKVKLASFPSGMHNDTWTEGGEAYWAAWVEWMSENY